MEEKHSLTDMGTDKERERERERTGRKKRDKTGVGVRREGAEEERDARWWANCSAVTQAPAYVEFNIKKHSLPENHEKP